MTGKVEKFMPEMYWEPTHDFGKRTCALDMEPCPDGMWVHVDDYEALAEAHKQLLKAYAYLQPIVPKGWKWMTHPDWDDGAPIPVDFFIDEYGKNVFQPFGAGEPLHIEDMESTWEEIPTQEILPEGCIAVREQEYRDLEAYRARTPVTWRRFCIHRMRELLDQTNAIFEEGFEDIFKKIDKEVER